MDIERAQNQKDMNIVYLNIGRERSIVKRRLINHLISSSKAYIVLIQ